MGKQVTEPQALSVKRAQVEFHNFASLGEPERAMRVYREENVRRGAIIKPSRVHRPDVAVSRDRRQRGPYQLHAVQ